jgi:hypothetical protein
MFPYTIIPVIYSYVLSAFMATFIDATYLHSLLISVCACSVDETQDLNEALNLKYNGYPSTRYIISPIPSK